MSWPLAPQAPPSAARAAAEPPKAEAQPIHPPAPPEPPADNAKPLSPLREIRLEFNNADQRVELRMVERAGDVHVAVRTPDARLAGAIREDLPALSARLEHTGFHAEGWHTGIPEVPRLASLATAAGSSPQDQQQQSDPNRGRQQQEDRQQPKQQESRKNDRKDFAWLFTSLR
jgi:hypothetical protein